LWIINKWRYSHRVVVLDTQKLSRPPASATIFTLRNLIVKWAARFIKRYKISLKKNETDSYPVFNETSSHVGHWKHHYQISHTKNLQIFKFNAHWQWQAPVRKARFNFEYFSWFFLRRHLGDVAHVTDNRKVECGAVGGPLVGWRSSEVSWKSNSLFTDWNGGTHRHCTEIMWFLSVVGREIAYASKWRTIGTKYVHTLQKLYIAGYSLVWLLTLVVVLQDKVTPLKVCDQKSVYSS